MDVKRIVLDALTDENGAQVSAQTRADLESGTDVSFETLDLDSLSRFEVMMQIEEALDIELDDDEVLEQGTVLGLVAFLETRLAGD